MKAATTIAALAWPALIAALNPDCAPGGNFDLSPFKLQLPTGSAGHPDTISSSDLQGCDGYQDYSTFFTESKDGALVMKVCGSPDSCGCVTTTNSKHCRTELREINSWSPTASKNRLAVSLAVEQPDNGSRGTVIGQIHIDDSISSKPVMELYYNSNGDLSVGVEQTRDGGNEVFTKVGNVSVGTAFTYEIRYEGGALSVIINGGKTQTLSTYSLNNPSSYFKAGNYNQGSSASDIHFYSIKVSH